MSSGRYETLRVQREAEICRIQFHRPDAKNAINAQLVEECQEALASAEQFAKIVILEGAADFFCFGADFEEVGGMGNATPDPGRLYDVWQRLTSGPFVSVAHVQGTVNAGGVGFVAASDIVLCKTSVPFSMSELLFGLMPACVFPFLVRRVGHARAHYMTLMTQPVSASQAHEWGLVDAISDDTADLLRKHLLRLRRLNKTAIQRYKAYRNRLDESLSRDRAIALEANQLVFSDPENIEKISRYVRTGKFPWNAE